MIDIQEIDFNLIIRKIKYCRNLTRLSKIRELTWKIENNRNMIDAGSLDYFDKMIEEIRLEYNFTETMLFDNLCLKVEKGEEYLTSLPVYKK